MAVQTIKAGAWKAPPSPSHPAVQMRIALSQRRKNGLPWDDEEFSRLSRAVSRHLSPENRQAWHTVFSEQRSVWKSAYDGSGVILRLNAEYLD